MIYTQMAPWNHLNRDRFADSVPCHDVTMHSFKVYVFQGLYSLSKRTSYHKISWFLEAMDIFLQDEIRIWTFQTMFTSKRLRLFLIA